MQRCLRGDKFGRFDRTSLFDGQTDGQKQCACMASRGKNLAWCDMFHLR